MCKLSRVVLNVISTLQKLRLSFKISYNKYSQQYRFLLLLLFLYNAATYFLLATTLCEKIEIVNVEDVISYTDRGPMHP